MPLPSESTMDRIRAEYRAEQDAEACRDTRLQFGDWRSTVELLFGADVLATLADAPTALRLDAA